MQNDYDDLKHTGIITFLHNYNGKMSTIKSYVNNNLAC